MQSQGIAPGRFNVYRPFSTRRQCPPPPQHLHYSTSEIVRDSQSHFSHYYTRNHLYPYHYTQSHLGPYYCPQTSQAIQPNIMDPEDREELQKLSNEYEADIQGPLVGEKQSSDALTHEYAQADSVYIAKTSTLAQTHSHYRTMKGDGNCGWRAVAFGYFENLFHLHDATKVQQEIARIKDFNKLFDAIGQQEHLYEIFVDATVELLEKLLETIEGRGLDDSFIREAFNHEYNSSAIITHFRLMTSAWMRLNPERYQAFLPIPLEQYCSRTVDTVKTEIDEFGLQGLVDGVINASGFAVEILYLDRSEGQEVTPHLLTPNDSEIATIRLLYRPGHYDLLYRTETPNPQPSVTPVNYQYSMTCNYTPWYPSELPFDLNPELMAVPTLSLDTATGSSASQATYPTQTTSDVMQQSMAALTPVSSEPQSTPSLPASPSPVSDHTSELAIRMNPLMRFELNTIPLTTIPFKNSHYNQAHFQNPHFQPSQWHPNGDNK